MPSAVDTKAARWTYGCEHELADWDCSTPMPAGLYRTPDHTVVNTNGVAAQPNVRVYGFGGEINTPPTDDPHGQARLLDAVLGSYRAVSVNHRSNLHVHVRVPGLRRSLAHLKRVQEYVHRELPAVLPLLEPVPPGVTPAERKRARRRRASHQTFLTPARLAGQLDARTADEFFAREVPADRAGRPLWHAQPRCCVNLRQLLQTDTVEFRHFPGTLCGLRLLTCALWCRDFLLYALRGEPLAGLWGRHRHQPWPAFPPFDEGREVRYQATASNNGLPRPRVEANIRLVLEGRFDAAAAPEEYADARRRAGCGP